MNQSFRSIICKSGLAVWLVLPVIVWANGGGQEEPAPEPMWTAQGYRLNASDTADQIVEVLPNGMTAIVRENRTAPVAAVRLYVKAGSIYEPKLGAGLSHLFEHLLAAGATQSRSEEESRKLIEQIGADYNAYTTKDHTCYHLTVPALHAGTALNLIADWVTRPTFPEESFKREWDVVQRELEMGTTDPERTMWKLWDELRYQIHPGRFPVIGYQSVVQQLTRKEILDYYAKMYVPDHCVIVVVGDINAEEMMEQIRREFSDFQRKGTEAIVLPDEPDVTAPREIQKVFPSLQGPAKLVVGFPTIKLQHADLYALDTLANILGEGKSSRLYQRLREKEQLVYSVAVYSYTPQWAPGSFMILCDLAPENIERTRVVIQEEIDRVIKESVKTGEVDRAKRQLQVGHIRGYQTAEQQASGMGRDYLSTGDEHFSEHYVQQMQTVTAQQIQSMAQRYLKPQKQLTLVMLPKELSDQAEKQGREVKQEAIKKVVLDNGLRVLLKRNKSVPLVNMQLYVAGGLLDETQQNNGITNLMTQLSLKGTADYTADDIVQYFDRVGGVITANCGNNTFFYQAEVMPDDFDKAFDLFSQVVLSPSFPQAELSKLKPVILAEIDRIGDSWPGEGMRFFREKFFVSSPYQRIQTGTKESVQSLDRAGIAAFHKQHTGAKRCVLAIFGDIDMDEAEQMARNRFSSMPAGETLDLNRFPAEPVKTKERMFVKQTPKNGATVHVGFPGPAMKDVQDRYPLEVLMGIVGSHTGWLHELLRGKGLVYYAGGYSMPTLLPGTVIATAQCEAPKAPQVTELIQQQMAKAACGEITEAEVARAKSNLINSEILSRQTNADMAMSASLDELYGFGYDWSQGHSDRIMAINPEEVKRVAKKYLSAPATVTINTYQPELFDEKEDQTPKEPQEVPSETESGR